MLDPDNDDLCVDNRDCGSGECRDGACACQFPYSGIFCQENVDIFTARSEHSVAYWQEKDIALVSFGQLLGNTVLPETYDPNIYIYDFSMTFELTSPQKSQRETMAQSTIVRGPF